MPGLDKMREDRSGEATATGEASADGFATAADFRNRFKKSTYTFEDGLTIEFRALKPIDFQTFRGSALTIRMVEAGVKGYNDTKKRQQFSDSLSDLAGLELVTDAAKETIIQAATDPKFTALPPDKCSPEKASIDTLSPTEVWELSDAIKNFSGGDEAEEMFREPGETDAEDTAESVAGGADEHADDSADSEGVQSESV